MPRIRALMLITLSCVIVLTSTGLGHAQQLSKDMIQEMRWRMIGPFRGGRTRAACGVPSEPNVFFVGQVDGGAWKSDDYGRTWTPIFDREPTQSIGAIAVAPSDPNVIYVASGEGLARPDLSVGDGIYKSTDAGKTWTHVWTEEGEQIPALAVDPHNPNRVFAAVLGHPYGPNPDRGIFRSTDGGQSWRKIFYVDPNTGGDDVEIDPSNPEVVYATLWAVRQGPWEYGNQYQGSEGGIFKSADSGRTWRKVTSGLPSDLVQAYVAIAPSEPSRLYATIATNHEGGYGSGAGLGIYRSDDGGAHWYRATNDQRPAAKIGGGDLPVPKVDPKNPDVLYVTSITTWRSRDGGKSWTAIKGAPGGDDYQNIWINPENPDIILLVSDQGAVVSVNRGRTWSSWYNQPTAQLYHVQTSNTFPYRVCSGQQESGSVCILERGNDGEVTVRDWRIVGAEEYAYVAPDPLHPDIVYGAGTNNVTKFHWSTGQVQDVTPIPIRTEQHRVDRTQPIIFSPVDPQVLYYGANVLFMTIDGGHSWKEISPDLSRPNPGVPVSLGSMAAKDQAAAKQRGVIYALGPSFTDVNTIWAGTDDGFIWVTRNGGKNWNNVTPPDMTAWSKVTQITGSHFDDDTAYASVSRFRIDDLRPYIYRTDDGGKMWELITNGLPRNAPVDTVREDPVRKGLLFAGTESGVWVSLDDGDHWQSLQLNMPHTSMRDLWIHGHDLIVATHGRSFWILDDITPLEQITGGATHSEATLFRPEAAYRVRRDTNTDTPLPPETPVGKNPPDGAIFDYYLGQPALGPVTLDILDANQNLVRHYASTQKPAVSMAELKKTLEIPLYWVRVPRVLPSSAGMHRWVWDLHYAPPASTQRDYPISAVPHDTPRLPRGPRALPGRYTVRLTVNGHTYTEPLTVKMDPRVKVSLAALTQQFRLEMRLASMMTQVAQAMRQARSVRTQVQRLSKETSGSLGQSVGTLRRKISALLGTPAGLFGPIAPKVTLDSVNSDAGTLYGSVDSADAAPTVAQIAALSKLERDFSSVMARWRDIETTDVEAINRQIVSKSLPVIRISNK
jgi:photosystem II stability/assembly factor-like uncharacterized protein